MSSQNCVSPRNCPNLHPNQKWRTASFDDGASPASILRMSRKNCGSPQFFPTPSFESAFQRSAQWQFRWQSQTMPFRIVQKLTNLLKRLQLLWQYHNTDNYSKNMHLNCCIFVITLSVLWYCHNSCNLFKRFVTNCQTLSCIVRGIVCNCYLYCHVLSRIVLYYWQIETIW